jgi:hypothetical protein
MPLDQRTIGVDHLSAWVIMAISARLYLPAPLVAGFILCSQAGAPAAKCCSLQLEPPRLASPPSGLAPSGLPFAGPLEITHGHKLHSTKQRRAAGLVGGK